MTNRREDGGLVGSFAEATAMLDCMDRARNAGIDVRDVFSPVGLPELGEVSFKRRSPVRFATFFGGVTGLIGGLALALWTSGVWDMIVGGKPVMSIVPFLVVGFELTILIGAISTLAALLVLTRLPNRRFPGPAYREEFSHNRFGLWLAPTADRRDEAEALLRDGGADVYPVGDSREVA